MTLRTNLVIKGVDQLTAPIKRMKASVTGFAGTGGIGKIAAAARSARSAMAGMTGTSLSGLSRLAGRARQAAGRSGVGAITASANLARKALGRLSGFAGKGLAVGTAGATFLGGWLTAGVIGLASDFEQFQVVLENTEGSAAKARKAMDWVTKFGATTPYQVSEVMEAFVALKAYGIDPMDGSLRSLGNAASGMSKGLMDAVEMLADAQTGEFERLKTFGIRASVAGDRVTLSYRKNGKEMTKTARKTGSEIQAAITGIFDSRFDGMMDRQSRTFKGMMSNLSDAFDNFQLTIARAGFFDFIRGKLQKLLGKVNELAKDGTLATWAKKISRWLEDIGAKASAFVENTDWKKVARDVGDVARAVWTLAKGLTAVVKQVHSLGTADPLGLGSWYDRNAPQWMKSIDRWGSEQLGITSGAAPRSAPARRSATRPGGPSIMGPGLRFGPPARQPGGLRFSPAATPRRIGRGQIDVNIRTERGTKAQVTRLSGGDGFDLSAVTRGKVGMA